MVINLKNIKRLLLLIVIILSLSSCALITNKTTTTPNQTIVSTTKNTTIKDITYSVPNPNNPLGYQVTFDFGDGYIINTTSTKFNYVLEPDRPEKNFANFLGWYSNGELFNFENQIKDNITLTAKWEYDYTSLVNYVYKETIKACVKIETFAYSIPFPSYKQSYSDSIGSGIIFDEDSSYYYVLTNNHVVYYDSTKYKNVEYHIYDCYGNVYGDPDTNKSLTSDLIGAKPEYDLAILRFSKGSKELVKVKLAISSKTSDVFSLGNPKGLFNTISFGNILGTKTNVPDPETLYLNNVTFDVIRHNSEINNGSSGGGLLNFSLELVGINFASNKGDFEYGYAIPVEKIKEFIEIYKS